MRNRAHLAALEKIKEDLTQLLHEKYAMDDTEENDTGLSIDGVEIEPKKENSIDDNEMLLDEFSKDDSIESGSIDREPKMMSIHEVGYSKFPEENSEDNTEDFTSEDMKGMDHEKMLKTIKGFSKRMRK